MCPFWRPGGGRCSIWLHSRRARKTGPKISIFHFRCTNHAGPDQKGFSCFPPGFAPYLRKPLVVCGLDGRAVLQGESDDSVITSERGLPAAEAAGAEQKLLPTSLAPFVSTVFSVAIVTNAECESGEITKRDQQGKELAIGSSDPRCWPRERVDSQGRCWAYQRRGLALASALMGLAASFTQRVRERIAAVLRLDLVELCELSRLSTMSKRYVRTATGVVGLLRQLRGKELYWDLALTGALAGRWGVPHCWDSRRKSYRPFPFPSFGTEDPG